MRMVASRALAAVPPSSSFSAPAGRGDGFPLKPKESNHEPVDETEAYAVLISRAERKTGSIPSQILVKHILSITRGGGWPVQREAMEALLRRQAFGRRDDLKIMAKPPRGAIYGLYRTSRGRFPARPYRTL